MACSVRRPHVSCIELQVLIPRYIDEQALRKHISDLQEYRQAGLTTFAEVDKYEKEKGQRVGYA